MKLLKQYFDLQKQIYDYFGYEENWRIIPLEDRTDMYWSLTEDTEDSGEVKYFEKPLTDIILEGGDYYSDEIYTQRFLEKWVYRAKDYTMICVDTRVDRNKFLAVFDNKKELKKKSKKS